MRFRTRATLTATAVGAAAAAALAVTVLPAASAVAGPPAVARALQPGPRAASGTPSPSDSASPPASASASGTPSPSPSPSASPSASPYPAGAPVLTISVPSRAATGSIIQLTGRVLGPDGKPAPAYTPVVIRALAYNRPLSSTAVVDRPIVGLDGRFTSVLGITRATYFSAQATNLGSGKGERTTTRRSLVVVKSVVTDVSLRIVGGKLLVKAALVPGQQLKVDHLYGIAQLSLVTRTGKVIRKLMNANITKAPSNGRHAFAFKPVPLPPPGSYVAITALGAQTTYGSTKPLKVPSLYVPPPRRPGTPTGPTTPTTPTSRAPSPSPSPSGVHSVF